VNCEGCAETISQSKLISVYLVPTVSGLPVVFMCEALLSWQAFVVCDKGSIIHGTVFVNW
jgi:hypothetical protein